MMALAITTQDPMMSQENRVVQTRVNFNVITMASSLIEFVR